MDSTSFRKRFEDLMRQAESDLERDPKGYRRRLLADAALGYAVIAIMLAVLIALLGGTLYAALFSTAVLILLVKSKIILVLAAAVWLLLRSLFVRISAPGGLPVTRAQFPKVWGEVDHLRAELGAQPVHAIVMVPDMNAAVAQTPRLGLIGPHKNTLVLGLEMLLTLSPEEARAVLAHELGHLSEQHGRFGNWIYRKRLTWARIHAAYDNSGGLSVAPLRRFISWYVPRLAGYSFALARHQEFEADAHAAALTSGETLANALVQTRVRDAITRETFWAPLLRRANLEPEPERLTFTKLYHHLKTVPLDAVQAGAKLSEALRESTGYTDTHPALKDRIAALSVAPGLSVSHETAAEAWLGDGLDEVLTRFDDLWFERNAPGWQARHAFARGGLERLRELVAKPARELTQDESFEVAELTEAFVPDVDPLITYSAYAKCYPGDARGAFALGRLMVVERKDPAGVPQLVKAAESRAYRESAFGLLSAFARFHSDHQSAEHWLRLAEKAHDDNDRARAERTDVTAKDTLVAPRLEAVLAARLPEAIKATSVASKIAKAWIAEKKLEQEPDQAVFVVALKPKMFARDKAAIGPALAKELPGIVVLPHTWFFVPARSENSALVKKIVAAGQEIPLS